MGRRAGGGAVLGLAGLLGLFGLAGVSCMSPTGGAQQLDHAIQARIDALALPRAPWSTLEGIPRGVRVRLDGGAVEVDDLTAWLALGGGEIDRRAAEGGEPPWTHVGGIRLEASDAGMRSDALLAAMERVRDGAAAARGGEHGGHVLFADAGVPFEHVVRVLYNAGQAKLRPASLAARREDGTVGVLPVSTGREFCEDDGIERESHSGYGAECWQPEVVVGEEGIVVRGKRSWQWTGECIRVRRYVPPPVGGSSLEGLAPRSTDAMETGVDEIWAGLMEDGSGDGGDGLGLGLGLEVPRRAAAARERPKPPPRPCRRIEVERVAGDPERLRHAIEAVGDALEPCGHATLGASETTRWQEVITSYDGLRAIGYGEVMLIAPVGDDDTSCEPAGG